MESMPAPNSPYYDYLLHFPVGVSMTMDLFRDDDGGGFDFTVKKIGDNSW